MADREDLDMQFKSNCDLGRVDRWTPLDVAARWSYGMMRGEIVSTPSEIVIEITPMHMDQEGGHDVH